MIYRISFALVLLTVCCPSLEARQNQYPSTDYQGFSGSEFSTTSPQELDSSSGVINNDYRAMSPSDWSEPESLLLKSTEGLSESTTEPGSTIFSRSNDGTDSYFQTPFKSASFPGTSAEPEPTTPPPAVPTTIRYKDQAPRYPLLADGDFRSNGIAQDGDQQLSIIRSPAQPMSSNRWRYKPASATLQSVSQTDMSYAELPTYRPEFGHRDAVPTVRHYGTPAQNQKFDFEEKKKEYPPLGEILATGRYFGSGTALFSKPYFQGNTAISESVTGINTTFDFDYEAAHQFQVGFESKFGPGFELNYMQYDETSNDALFTSDGANAGSTNVWMLGPNRWSRLTAGNAGDTLQANHTNDVETISASFFKEVKLPISRINGKFGFEYVSISHTLDAEVRDAGNSVVGSLRNFSDLRAYGPHFTMQYFRPVGHTKLELITSVSGAVLFGRQDQVVTNTETGDLSSIGADEFITKIGFMSGVQYKKMIGENRYLFGRLGYSFETWLNGGTGLVPQDDFGLRGVSFTVGYNR